MPNFLSIMQDKIKASSNQLAFLFLEDGKTETAKITFGELDKYARAIAVFLQSKGAQSKRIILIYPAGMEFISAFIGCLYAGAIAIPMQCPELSESKKIKTLFDCIAEDADVSGVMTLASYMPIINEHCHDIITKKNIWIMDSTKCEIKMANHYQHPDLNDHDTAYLQYTSGSTAKPKGTMISYSNLFFSLENTAKIWHYTPKSISLTWAPHSHVYGLICGLLLPFYNSTLAIFMPTAVFIKRPLNWLEAITKYQVTHSGCPNFGFDLCVENISKQDLQNLNLSHWQVAVNGGEMIKFETLKKFHEVFSPCGFSMKQFNLAFGMSELTGGIAVSKVGKPPHFIQIKRGALKNNKVIQANKNSTASSLTVMSVGQALPHLDIKIVDPEKCMVLPSERIGEIWVCGKSVAKGYWNKPELNHTLFKAKLKNSNKFYFRTGDLGFIHQDELFITGRLKEIIVVYGEKYYPYDLEMTVTQALHDLDCIPCCTVFSFMDEKKEQVIFVQEIKPYLDPDKQHEIKNRIRQIILQNFGLVLKDVILVTENSIPKTTSGKLQRKLCQQQYLENKLKVIDQDDISKSNPKFSTVASDPSKLTTFTQIIADLLKIPQDSINLHEPLANYLFDSISLIKLSGLLNAHFNLDTTPATLFEYKTLEQFFNEKILLKTIPLRLPKTSKQQKADVIADIAIIGLSCQFPDANSADQFWKNLIQGKNSIREIPKERWDWQAYYGDSSLNMNKTQVKWGGFIDNMAYFDAAFFNIFPREAELIDPQQRLLLQNTWNAIEDAGYQVTELATLNVGLFIGMFTSDYMEIADKNNITDAYTTTGLSHCILANRVSYLLNFSGPCEVINTACSSSLVAIHEAVRAIQMGDCELAIAGGVNALLTPTLFLAADKAGFLSKDGISRAFDKSANGYVRGEGVAAILLKPLRKALEDHDHIYGVIKGSAVNHGGHVSGLTVPNPNAQADVIRKAIEEATISVNTLQYIETHGTGTVLGDPIEVNGLKKAFTSLSATPSSFSCGLGSVKTNIGHLEGAAGVASLIKVLLSFKHQQIPGILNFEELNPYIELKDSPFYIVNKNINWNPLKNDQGESLPRRAGVSSFGFGGTNAHLIIEEAPEPSLSVTEENFPQLCTLSAKTEQALRERLRNLLTHLQNNTESSLAAICYTLNRGREHFAMRCVIIASTIRELIEKLTALTQNKLAEDARINIDVPKTARLQALYQEVEKTLTNAINLIVEPTDPSYLKKLRALADFYLEGFDLDWESLHRGEKRRIALPGYPFAKEKFWIKTVEPQTIVTLEQFIPETPVIENQELPQSFNEPSILQIVQEDVVNLIATILKINPSQISLTSTLSEQAFDSITFKELSVRLEDYYDIELNPATFFSFTNIQDLSHYLVDTYSESIKKKHTETEFVKKKSYLLNKDITSEKNKLSSAADEVTQKPIAIIGMAGLFPQSKNLQEFWQHLLRGDDLITEIPNARWDWKLYYSSDKQNAQKTNSKWGSFINDFDYFDAAFFNISSREANLMDPQHRLFMEVVWHAIEDAGYDPFSLAKKNIGLFAGIEFNEYENLIRDAKNNFYDGHILTGSSSAMLTNRLSYFFNFHGSSQVIHTTCSSALVAIHSAVTALRNNECLLAIAGGVNLNLSPDTYIKTSQLGVLSPDGRCKTFDKSANGYVKGEGVAALLLKPLTEAIRDHDYIYGVIKGSAVMHGGKSQSLTAPNSPAQTELILETYKNTNILPETITYVEAHGTGTELGDPIEVEALNVAFHQMNTTELKTHYCGLGSVKTNVGHLEPASGIVGVIKVLLSMDQEIIPPILHFKNINPYINLKNSPFFIVDKKIPWPRVKDENGNLIPKRAGVSAFGVGGTNAHLLIEERPALPLSQTTRRSSFLMTFSAKETASLKQKIIDLHTWLQTASTDISLADLCYTFNKGRAHFDKRAAFVVDSIEELNHSLAAVMNEQPLENYVTNTTKIAVSNDQDKADQEQRFKTLLQALDQETLSHDEYRQHLLALAALYCEQFTIDWDAFYHDEKRYRLAKLPSYPFIKKRYWFDQEWVTSPSQQKPLATPIQKTEGEDEYLMILNYLRSVFAEELKLSPEEIDIHSTYEVYGIDSLLGSAIILRLEDDLKCELSKTLLYEYSQLTDLARYLEKDHLLDLKNILTNQTTTLPLPSSITMNEEVMTPSLPEVSQPSSIQDVAIIGLSGIFPEANDMQEFWENLAKGRDCISEVPPERWDYKNYPVEVGGKIKYYPHGGFIPDIDKFDPLFFNISPYDASLMDPQERLFMQTAWTTLEDAGYTRERLKRLVNNQVGVIVGVTYNFYPLFIAEEWTKGNRLPLDIQLFSVANRVSYFLNLKGPSYIVDTACSSSLAAIHLAYQSILQGECTMAIAGGVNLSLHPAKYHMLGCYSFMSDEGRCTSFGEGGTGYVPGEGVGAILLKPLSLAIRDQDRIYGVIKASGMNHGGKTSGYSVPNPNAQAELIKETLKKGNINPRSISYVEAHGTGTALGDPIEIKGLQIAFEQFTQEKQFCAVGSVKSNIGHLESAAGISQMAKVLLQMQQKKLVPTLHTEKLNPNIHFSQTPFYVQQTLTDWETPSNTLRRAGISSFGAGGTNIHMIVEEYAQIKSDHSDPGIFILLISALTTERLQEYVKKVFTSLTTEQQKQSPSEFYAWLIHYCYTSQIGRESMAHRIGFMSNSPEDLLKQIELYIQTQHIESDQSTISLSTKAITDLFANKRYEDLINAWMKGATIPWEKLYNTHLSHIISIPTYPFAKRHCWIESKTADSITQPKRELPSYLANWFYQTHWEENALSFVKKTSSDHWFIFADETLGSLLQKQFVGLNSTLCSEHLRKEPDFNKVLLPLFSAKKPNITGIIYILPAETEHSIKLEHHLFHFFKSLIQLVDGVSLTIWVISRNSQPVMKADTINIWQYYLWSFVQIFGAEQPAYQVYLLDLDAKENASAEALLIEQEVNQSSSEQHLIAYREGKRYVPRLVSYPVPSELPTLSPPKAALITGGLGAIGSEVCQSLVTLGAKYLLLTGRMQLPSRDQWETIQEKALQEKILTLQALEKQGIQVKYAAVDVVDHAKMQDLIKESEQEWQVEIDSVFHLSGVTTDNITIDNMTQTTLDSVLAPKIQGSLVLHELFQKKSLKYFVLFSSIAAMPYFGMRGLSAYAMANAFLDGLAAFRSRQGLSATSINWSAWGEKGMSFRYSHSQFLEAVGMSTISIAKGIEALSFLLNLSINNVAVLSINWQKFLKINPDARKTDFFKHFLQFDTEATARVEYQNNLSEVEIKKIVLHELATILHMEEKEIEVNEPYQNYGLDSIIGVNFVAKLNQHFPEMISPMDLFKYPNVHKLIQYIYQKSLAIPSEKNLSTFNTELTDEEVSKMIDEELKRIDDL